jgi:hypothetical protein
MKRYIRYATASDYLTTLPSNAFFKSIVSEIALLQQKQGQAMVQLVRLDSINRCNRQILEMLLVPSIQRHSDSQNVTVHLQVKRSVFLHIFDSMVNNVVTGQPEVLQRSDASPPDRKRARRSPVEQQGQQAMPNLSQQQPSGQLAAQTQNNLMRPIPNPMTGSFPQGMGYMGNNPALAMQMGQPMGPQAAHTMSPALSHPGVGMLPQQMSQVRVMLTVSCSEISLIPEQSMGLRICSTVIRICRGCKACQSLVPQAPWLAILARQHPVIHL